MTEKLKDTSNIMAPVSVGELIDKITILEIKKIHMTGVKLNNINKELKLLTSIIKDKGLHIDPNLINDLKNVNNCLWDIEDRIRRKENQQEFDKEFIELARSVYKENDRRFSIKQKLNQKYNSELIEEKSYTKYSR